MYIKRIPRDASGSMLLVLLKFQRLIVQTYHIQGLANEKAEEQIVCTTVQH